MVFIMLSIEADNISWEVITISLEEVELFGVTRRKRFGLFSVFSIGISGSVSEDLSSLISGNKFKSTDFTVGLSSSNVDFSDIFSIVEVYNIVVSVGILDLVVNAFE